MKKERLFKDSEDLAKLVQEEGFLTYEIEETVNYDGNELNNIVGEKLFDESTNYLAHIGMGICLITGDYYDNVSERYRPEMILDITEDIVTIVKEYHDEDDE